MVTKIVVLATSVALVGVLASSCERAPSSTADDEELLWSLEEAYLRGHREADHEAVLAMWDEALLAWPSRLPNPTGKDGGKEYMQTFFPEPGALNQRIERQGIRFEGKVAILYYRLYLWPGAEFTPASGITRRLTHTWIKRGSSWFILGGMDWTEPREG